MVTKRQMELAARALGIPPIPPESSSESRRSRRGEPIIERLYEPDPQAQEQAIRTLLTEEKGRDENGPGGAKRDRDGLRATRILP